MDIRQQVMNLVKHYPEVGIVSRDLRALIGKECSLEILKDLEDCGMLRSHPTHNRRRGTRWFPTDKLLTAANP